MIDSVTNDRTYSCQKILKILNALFIVAGTCIGGGMLALPISSSVSGFWPSILVMFISCVFMTITGLLFLEATLWMKKDSHVITLSKELLNNFGQMVCWVIYLFICYASMVAYTSGAGKEISFVFNELFHLPMTNVWGSILYVAGFSSILYFGFHLIGRVNTILFVSMIAAYLLIVFYAPKEIQYHLLQRQNWNTTQIFFLLPLMLTTFSFPGIVPTIIPYLNRDVKAIKIAIIGGTSLTFIVYAIWLFIVLGTVPFDGEHGLNEAFLCDVPATECLHYAIKNPIFSYIAQFFAFFALTTSFLGIGLALFDFLSDGLHIDKKRAGKLILNILIVVPTLIFAIYFQRAFITALELSGGIGDAIISGLIPVAMVWMGRYKLSKKGEYTVFGGKILLCSIAIFSILILTLEIFRRLV